MTSLSQPHVTEPTPGSSDQVALSVDGLSLGFRARGGLVPVLHDVSLNVARGEIVGLVGESGSGKSVTSLQVARLLPEDAVVVSSGDVLVGGRSTLRASAREMNSIRGSRIGFIFQEPMTALNPTMTIGRQLGLVIRRHTEVARADLHQRVIEAISEVRIKNPEAVARQYPFELSGGMRQRIVIALAMVARPMLLIADEPTTALDVTVQAEILNLIRALAVDHGTAVLFVSHDLAVISELCSRVFVMYGGEIVEQGPTRAILDQPQHPYTQALIAVLPRVEAKRKLNPIPGEPPDPRNVPTGCVFQQRCPFRFERCLEKPPQIPVAPGRSVACWLADPAEQRHG